MAYLKDVFENRAAVMARVDRAIEAINAEVGAAFSELPDGAWEIDEPADTEGYLNSGRAYVYVYSPGKHVLVGLRVDDAVHVGDRTYATIREAVQDNFLPDGTYKYAPDEEEEE